MAEGVGSGERPRDLLQTLVIVCIVLTPAWLGPPWWTWLWTALVAVVAAPAVWFTWTGAPWVPTPHAELERLVPLLALAPGERFVDLGAGDGRVLRHVARATDAEVIGVEASVLPWMLGRLRGAGPSGQLLLGSRYGPAMPQRLGLAGARAVYLWSTPYGLAHPKLPAVLGALPAGARVVTYGTPLPFWRPREVDRTGQRPLFCYVVGSSSERQETT